MEIKINKEIKEYNETMFFGLSVRQFICAILACGAAVGIYFGCRSFMGTETLSWLCMLGAAPFAALGFIRYNGMYAEQIARAWIRSEILMPKYLTLYFSFCRMLVTVVLLQVGLPPGDGIPILSSSLQMAAWLLPSRNRR